MTEEITIEGISSDADATISQAVYNGEHDFTLKTDVTIGGLTEDNVWDLLEEIYNYEEEMSEMGAYDKAEAADRIGKEIRNQAMKEGVIG